MEPEFIDEERIPLLERDEDSQAETIVFMTYIQQAEKRLSYNERHAGRSAKKRRADQRSRAQGFNVKNTSPKSEFDLGFPAGTSRLKNPRGIRQRYKIQRRISRGEYDAHTFRRVACAVELLGIETPSSVRSRTRVLIQDIPTELEMDDLSPERLEEVIAK